MMDATLAAVALALLSPLFLILALAVKALLGSPILFRQLRPGLNGKPFEILKFRTMAEIYDGKASLLPDERRITRFGRFLRSCSLDEFPELINVLKGDMSLVGPRPLLMQYLDRYTPTQARRHEVRPGITRWAQVNGRNAITWEQKFALDVWYVDHLSFALDLRIILLTGWKTIRREGITQAGRATMDEFMG